MNDPVLNASVPQSFYSPCTRAIVLAAFTTPTEVVLVVEIIAAFPMIVLREFGHVIFDLEIGAILDVGGGPDEDQAASGCRRKLH